MIRKPQKVAVAVRSTCKGKRLDTQAIGNAIDAERQRVFKALAIVRAIARLLTEISAMEEDDLDCADALSVAGDLLDEALERLEPLQLGLGIPRLVESLSSDKEGRHGRFLSARR